MTDNGASYIYLGLAGETGPGRRVDSGLFRFTDGSGEWERIEAGLAGSAGRARLGGAPAEA